MQVEWRHKNRTIEIKSLETILYYRLNITMQYSLINIAIVVVNLELNWQTASIYFQTNCCIFFSSDPTGLREENQTMKVYIDQLVMRVMEECPEALATGSTNNHNSATLWAMMNWERLADITLGGRHLPWMFVSF